MKLRFLRTLGAALLAASALLATGLAHAAAVNIEYALSSLGGNSYRYTYTITNVSLSGPVQDILLDFDAALFDELSLVFSNNGRTEWSGAVFGSVFGTPAQLDIYTSGAGLGIGEQIEGLSIDFTWNGVGLPGAQAFTVYDPATFTALDAGVTVPADVTPPGGVPEPATASLVLLALLCLGSAGRRGRALQPAPV